MNLIEEKLRLLKPILAQKQWEYLRLSYAMEKDFKKRFQIENLMDMLIAQKVPGLQMDQILLPPPDMNMLRHSRKGMDSSLRDFRKDRKRQDHPDGKDP